jgi:hypothetical protein
MFALNVTIRQARAGVCEKGLFICEVKQKQQRLVLFDFYKHEVSEKNNNTQYITHLNPPQCP